MAHAFPRDDVRQLIAKVIGAWPASNVIFRDEPEPMLGPKNGVVQGLVRLDVSRRGSSGGDDIKRIETADGLREIYGGQRSVVLVVRVESHRADTPAYDVLEGARLRLNFISTLAEFRRVGLALADWGDIVPIANPVQNRMVSTAVLELFLNQVVELEDPMLGGIISKVASGHPVDPSAAPVVDLGGTFTP